MSDGEKIALRILSHRWQTTQRLKEKLERRGIEEPELGAVLEKMAALGYLDDNRYAEFWLREKIEAGKWGPRRLNFELQRQGVAPQIVEEHLSRLFPPDSEREWELALAAGAKKYQQLGKDPKAAAKTGAALARWGFNQHVIWRVLRELEEDPP